MSFNILPREWTDHFRHSRQEALAKTEATEESGKLAVQGSGVAEPQAPVAELPNVTTENATQPVAAAAAPEAVSQEPTAPNTQQ